MYLWTSEAVSSGHPDKVADQIADTILDAYLKADPEARVASEVTILKDYVLLSGEISSKVEIDVEPLVRDRICRIGYDRDQNAFNGNTCKIENKIAKQSPEIAAAVVKENGEIGAGDQGIMFGFASNETPNFMPLAHHLSFEIIRLLETDIILGRKSDGGDGWDSPLLPDAKTQVTVEYGESGIAKRIDTVVISSCHKPGMTLSDVQGYIYTKVVSPLLKGQFGNLFDSKTRWLINPAGEWNVGGPASDTGLSGRKIVVDNYGADCPIGGGSFSGKDPTKVDRSAAYMARYLAKNVVAANIARRATVQLSYAIGVAEPVSVRLQMEPVWLQKSFDANIIGDMLQELVDLTPKGIIERFDLRRPIFNGTASGGHFGRDLYPWEKVDLVPALQQRIRMGKPEEPVK